MLRELILIENKNIILITMCIVHKGFRGFRAVSPASILDSNLIGLNSAIPYDTIHSPLGTSGGATVQHSD